MTLEDRKSSFGGFTRARAPPCQFGNLSTTTTTYVLHVVSSISRSFVRCISYNFSINPWIRWLWSCLKLAQSGQVRVKGLYKLTPPHICINLSIPTKDLLVGSSYNCYKKRIKEHIRSN